MTPWLNSQIKILKITKIKKFPYLPTYLPSVREGSLGEPQLFVFGLIGYG
jgi:hypothetical protein